MAQPITYSPSVVLNGGIDESKSPVELDAKKWRSGLDAEPLTDGVRRRNGTADINAALSLVAISHVPGTDSRAFTDGVSEYIAQSFTTVGATIVRDVAVRLKISAGSPTGNIDCTIHADNAGVPAGAVTVVCSSIDGGLSITTGTYAWFRFHPLTFPTLSAATKYHIRLVHLNAAAGNTFSVEEATVGGYVGGNVTFSTNGSAWTASAGSDLNFRIYAGAGSINSITLYPITSPAVTYRLVSHGGEMYSEEAGTMRPVSTLERSTLASGADLKWSVAIGQDLAHITDGSAVGRVFYRIGATEYWENEGLARPATAITLTAAAGGTLPNGTWYVDYYFWNNDLAIKSNTNYQGVNAASVVLAGANGTINVSGLPATVARTGDRATHIRLSIKGPGFTGFRYSGVQVTLGTTTASITADNSTTPIEYDDDVAPVHAIKLVADNRQFIARGITGQPGRVMFSKISGADAFYSSFPILNYRDFGRGDGDYVTALAFVPPRSIVVGLKNSVWMIDSRNPLTSDQVLIAKGVGIAGALSWIVVGRNLFFVSDADRTKGMMLWDGSEVRNIGGLDTTFKALNQSRLQHVSCAHMATGDGRFQWWTLASRGGQTAHDRCLMYDYNLNAWSVYSIGGELLGTIEEADNIARVWIGRTDGFVRRSDSGSMDAGAAYTATVQGRDEQFGAPGLYKRLRAIRYFAKGFSTGGINLAIEVDYSERPTINASLQQAPGGVGSILGSGVLGAFILGSTGNVYRKKNLHGSGRTFTSNFSGANPWHLLSYTYGVQPTGRK